MNKTVQTKYRLLLTLLLLTYSSGLSAAEPVPSAELLWQNDGQKTDLMLRLNRWEPGLEGYNINRRAISATGAGSTWTTLNSVEPLTPYAAADKDLSNVESDAGELKQLRDYNKEQVGKILRDSTKEQGWEDMLKPGHDNRTLRMLNYFCRRDYRLAKLIGLGLTDRQLPKTNPGDRLEYALVPVRKGKPGEPVHRVTVTPGQKPAWPVELHFHVERRKFAKDSMLRFSWLAEELKKHQITGFMTFYRKKGSDAEYRPTSKNAHPLPATGEHTAFHKWASEDSEYEYALACVNAFGSHGPLLPEGTSTDKFRFEDGPPIAAGVKLTNFYSDVFTIAKMLDPKAKPQTSTLRRKTNGIGTIKFTFAIRVHAGKNYLVITHEGNLDKVDLKCLVKATDQAQPLISSGQMKSKISGGKLAQYAELAIEKDAEFIVVTEVWTR